ncbi:MAG: tetraacyldisaccharide 4'-kinase [Gammaproteobacteria bacterium]
MIKSFINKLHYTNHSLAKSLLPISLIYRFIVTTRKLFYKNNIFKSTRLSIPIIVVGNITTGGTGKTPLVIYLAKILTENGFKPGIISRGYKAKTKHFPHAISHHSTAKEVGDEPLLIYNRTQCPVVIDPNRVRGAKQLISNFDCNIIISDDGLQHYALARDIEIAVVDAARLFGNGYCLPAGPLRESVSRLNEVTFVVYNGEESSFLPPHPNPLPQKGERVGVRGYMTLQPTQPINLLDPNKIWNTTTKIHAVAGIGHPQRFFETLKSLNFEVIEHPFPDHHDFKPSDISFNDNLPVMMTEKDAVKCFSFAKENHWYLPVSAKLSDTLVENLMIKIKNIK